MKRNSDVIRDLFTAIDRQDWTDLRGLVSDDIAYYRPGCPMIFGVDDLVKFYIEDRVISDGSHDLARVLADDSQGFCWGEFRGVSKHGVPLVESFAEWYGFSAGKISVRRTFFYRPAV